MSPIDVDATLTTLAAMCQQEETGYKTCPYMYQSQPPQSCAVVRGPAHCSTASSAAADAPVDIDCRNKMAAWCYQVVDFCKFNRETVAISMNYLDRFMRSPSGAVALEDRKVYQLVAMTTLYTAVKIHEPEAMDPKLVSTLSRGTYSPAQVEAMEATILPALQWRLNPPTAMAFVRQLLDLLPLHIIDSYQRDAVYDLSKFQTELAVSEYDFLNVHASIVGYCALMNALESVGVDDNTLAYMSIVFSQAIHCCLDGQSDTVYEVQNWLYKAVLNQPATHGFSIHSPNSASSSSLSDNKAIQRTSSIEVSPRSAAQCGC
jgi:Cyclin, N-terminal domain/Cyclin, C-terminal domain